MPALSDPDLSVNAAKAIAEAYSEAVGRVLAVVVRRLERGIDRAGWAETKLTQLEALRGEVSAIVSRLQAGELVRTAVELGHDAGVDAATVNLVEIGADGPLVMSDTRTVEQLVREAVDNVTATHVRILRSADDIYRSVIAETTQQVAVGSVTRRQAASTALQRFAAQGVTGFVDRAGRNWQLETYVEAATRTAVTRAQTNGRLDTYQANDRDLVIVTDAPEECEVCRPWEGRVLSISGAGGRATVRDATSAGLFHVNCRHDVLAWIPGLSRQMGNTADPEGDVARRRQRELERGIRSWKRRDVAALTDADRTRARAKVREWQGRLREHVAATDRKRLRHRESIRAAR